MRAPSPFQAFRRVMGYSPTQYVKLMAEQENENMTIPLTPYLG